MRSFIFSLSLLLLGCSSGTQISPHAGKMIVPGVGTDEIRVDMSKAEIAALLGEPEAVSNEGRRLDYRESFGLDFFLGDAEHAAEVHFTQGFRGRLPSRIAINSRMLDVFKAYGTPAARLEVSDQTVGRKDRVLYKTPDAYKISYNHLGLSFWFSLQKRVTQIVVFKPLPDRDLRVEPQKSGAHQVDQ
jgi:hypothetical protein